MPFISLGSLLSPLASLVPTADWHGPGWWIVFVPLFWIALFVLLGLAFRGRGWGPGGWCGPGAYRYRAIDPEQLLERRFAEGELTAEQYRERRDVLRESSADRR
jgi:putative membrane protein